MKLYTEEQVIQILYWMSPTYMVREQVEERIKKELTPIELPSDEDAGVTALKIVETLKDKHTAEQEAFYLAGFQTCVKWLKEQILNQNKS